MSGLFTRRERIGEKTMNLRKRLKRVEERAEHYLETVDDRNCDENEVTRMLRAMGGKGLAEDPQRNRWKDKRAGIGTWITGSVLWLKEHHEYKG